MKHNNRHNTCKLTAFSTGLTLGILVTAIAVWLLMPGLMIVEHQSKYSSVDETVSQLQKAIVANGWTSPAVRNMNKSIEKQGLTLDRQVHIVELCHAQHAKAVLNTNPELATLMPCAWGVYQRDNKIYISGMNMGLMGKVFGGNVAAVMGNKVAKEEKVILSTIVN